MSPIQQMLLGAGAVTTKTYMDDVFSTYLYDGNGGSTSVPCGIDFTDGGGMVWTKCRSHSGNHQVWDTVRGVYKRLRTDGDDQEGTEQNSLTSFSNGAFALSSDGDSNANNKEYASWSFKRAEGFLDIVEFSGSGAENKVVSHGLGCKPGMIILKRTDSASEWHVWHKDLTQYYDLRLNQTAVESNNYIFGAHSDMTATTFKIAVGGNSLNYVNQSGSTWVAYLFAGGLSDSYLARSVAFDGSDDYIRIGTSSDFAFGTGDFTIEAWINPADSEGGVIYDDLDGGNTGTVLYTGSDGLIRVNTAYWRTAEVVPSTYKLGLGSWTHVAYTCQGSTNKIYINGCLAKTWTNSLTRTAPTNYVYIGRYSPSASNALYFNGKISNLRVVKGTAVYTSSFRVPTEPLTNITNTVLLCCNNGNNDQSAAGSTVAPSGSSFSAYGGATLSTNCPFDDPTGYVFGDSGTENIIECGSYLTDDGEDATINLGWEPQWVLAKRTDSNSAADWMIVDSMRGFPNAQNVQQNNSGECNVLEANTGDAENNTSRLGLTSTGFFADQFGADREYIYVAIRRPDGYVSRPVGDATKVFTMSTGNSSDFPAFTSGFPVDFALQKRPATTENWMLATRLTGKYYLRTNKNDSQTTFTDVLFDSNTGWLKGSSYTSSWQSWMWKRYAGFDVVTYEGNNTSNTQISHSLNAVPQMIWIKKRDTDKHWVVGHFGINGGTNPWNYFLELNTLDIQEDNDNAWYDTAPTSTNFTLGHLDAVNNSGGDYVALLFTSVSGISKCGYYNGSDNTITITTGFQPRFLMVKRVTGAVNAKWWVFDTQRGWGTTSSNGLELNDDENQSNMGNISTISSTGFTLTSNNQWNGDGEKYIYYAHA